jgi:predicted ATPase/transcriptional regulator with XRE-family HTH domain
MNDYSYRERDYPFGRAMLGLRTKIGLTQAGLGDLLGVSRRAVLSWEAGEKYPNNERLKGFIKLALEHQAFPPDEAEAIRELWQSAHQKVLLDETWLDTILHGEKPTTTHPNDDEKQIFNNLPFQPTSFIGRANELTQIASILSNPECRLLTLLGPGGVGKTRLALEVAANSTTTFSDGVAFVALASLATPNQIVLAIGESLNLSFAKQPDPTTYLLAYLRERNMLLVLDNFEHLLEGTELIRDILAHAPCVTMLTTSRERLNLQAEWLFDVEGLSYPPSQNGAVVSRNLEELANYGAINLFLQRALQVQPEMTLSESTLSTIVKICQHVAGLPLAIELAATSVRTLPVAEIERQIISNLDALTTSLRDVPPRHRSLRAVFDHSWKLLDEPERAVLGRLAIFRGSWDRAAAQAICTQPTEPSANGDYEKGTVTSLDYTFSPLLLTALVDKSLVQQVKMKTSVQETSVQHQQGEMDAAIAPRFMLLEPIREYALEQLTARGKVEVLQRAHASYYANVAEAAAAQWGSPTTDAVIEGLDRERDNLRAALQWARDGGDSIIGLRLASALVKFWRRRGALREERSELEELLARNRDRADPNALALRLRASQGAAWLASDHQDYERARQLFEESKVLQDALGKTENDIDVSLTVNAAMEARAIGKYPQARALFEEVIAQYNALSIRQNISSPGLGLSSLGLSHFLLGLVRREQGDFSGARDIFEERIAFHREIDDPEGVAIGLMGLSDVARDLGQVADVRKYGTENLAKLRELGMDWAVGFALNSLALAAYQEGDLAQAFALISESVAIFRSQKADGSLAEVLITQGHILRARGNLKDAHDTLTEALRLSWLVAPRLMVIATLEGLATVMVQTEQVVLAVRVLSATATLREEMQTPVPPATWPVIEQTLETAKSTLGAEDFKTAWSKGKVPLEQMLVSVLGKIPLNE